jgi:hypothetical protein
MNNRQKRIEALGKRFADNAEQPKSQTKPQQGISANNQRRRHSLYINANLMKQIDEVFKVVKHDVYPVELTKSAFIEKLLEHSLANLEAVKTAIVG